MRGDTKDREQDEHTAARPWYRRRVPLACAAASVVVAGTLAFAVPLAAAAAPTTDAATVAIATPTAPGTTPGSANGRGAPGGQGDGQSTSTVAEATEADADESAGVVIIETVLGYQQSAAAGTGVVLTEDGLVLTNNHVIEGATEISVTVADTGETYTATLLGTDDEDDVALLQLQDASGLATTTIDDDGVATGDTVTAVGNADGGGVLMAADGVVTGLETTVTTSASGTVASETLDGMIQIVADVVSGDSGGALLDDEGEVVGITTAASSGTATTVAYAIPIEDALAIAQLILDGDESDGVALGYPAFLGIQLSQNATGQSTGFRSPGATAGTGTASTTTGATISSVIDGAPAADAGLGAGDTITAVDGAAVTDAEALSEMLGGYDPGDTVTIAWTDAAGTTHSASVTLIAGPVS
ncbi:S1C family serine protease [Microbacterium sp. 18062]|uniref:S1C family serine protease n=1 Tax=Microbacterium sp. 18062 TaxID=2681410 RepID=UPI00135BC17A|nr:trypsin-like peptidase domain-containing protein [Microbacterium sp. 18062]